MNTLSKILFRIGIGSAALVVSVGDGKSAMAQDLPSRDVEILNSSTVSELKHVAARSAEENRRLRACEFQRFHRLPPTFCYRNARDQAELDAQCVNLSRSATRIPKIDPFTSSICRDALEKRRRDLAYAAL